MQDGDGDSSTSKGSPAPTVSQRARVRRLEARQRQIEGLESFLDLGWRNSHDGGGWMDRIAVKARSSRAA
jgi:hypothetical protein